MKKCPKCGKDIPAIAKKCEYCGEWQDKHVVNNALSNLPRKNNVINFSKGNNSQNSQIPKDLYNNCGNWQDKQVVNNVLSNLPPKDNVINFSTENNPQNPQTPKDLYRDYRLIPRILYP